MDQTTITLIIIGIVGSFIANLLVELFVNGKTAKSVLQIIFCVLFLGSYMALLGYLFRNRMPSRFVLLLFILGGLAGFMLMYQLVARAVQNRGGTAGEGARDQCSHDSEAQAPSTPSHDPAETVAGTDTTLSQGNTREDLLTAFDKAVHDKDESLAIIYGYDLLPHGEMLHVMLGFRKLAEAGLQDSKLLYVTLALRLSRATRESKNPVFFQKMQLNELESALVIANQLDDKQRIAMQNNLYCEKMAWLVIAARAEQSDEKKQNYLHQAQEIKQNIYDRLNADWKQDYNNYLADLH